MALMRLYEPDTKDKSSTLPSPVLVQAAGILEHLILKSPHNYEALLLLVRIYLLLGAGSEALKSFPKLSVKQMQYETVAHNLFTRLATIHPHAAPPFEGLELKDVDPQMAMRQALLFYRGSESSIPYACKTGLENGSYVNVQKTIDFQKSLENSICRRMWALETRRMQRMIGGPGTSQYDHIGKFTLSIPEPALAILSGTEAQCSTVVSETAPVVDKRNFDGFMNCELPGEPSFEEHVRLGPLPGVSCLFLQSE